MVHRKDQSLDVLRAGLVIVDVWSCVFPFMKGDSPVP